MFREGYYLEIIKAKYSAATAVITVKEKTVEIKNKKITTNKWLTLEDWASLYEILEKALAQKSGKTRASEKRKFTRHLEIKYTFEVSENPSDRTSLPTMRVAVSPVRKKSSHKSPSSSKKLKNEEKVDNTEESIKPELLSAEIPSSDCKTELKIEEYIPDAPNANKIDEDENGGANVGYVPSRKSTLEFLQQSANSNEYVPAVLSEEMVGTRALDALYVPNSIPKSENFCETYEPSSLMVATEAANEYIPNSKGVRKKVDEYQPDFIVRNKTMKFDNSYVPSSSERIKELKKNDKKSSRSGKKSKPRETEGIGRDSDLAKKNSTLGQSEIKREM